MNLERLLKIKLQKMIVDLMNQIISKIKPHQIYAAGDLSRSSWYTLSLHKASFPIFKES